MLGAAVWQAAEVSEQPSTEPTPLGPRAAAAAYGLVLFLALLLAVWGAFLVPLRWGTVVLPVSWVVAAAGNLVLGRVGARLLGRPGAIGPGVVWLVVALTLGSKRSEGDLIVPGTTPGLVYLLVGAVAGAVAYALAPRSRD